MKEKRSVYNLRPMLAETERKFESPQDVTDFVRRFLESAVTAALNVVILMVRQPLCILCAPLCVLIKANYTSHIILYFHFMYYYRQKIISYFVYNELFELYEFEQRTEKLLDLITLTCVLMFNKLMLFIESFVIFGTNFHIDMHSFVMTFQIM